MASNKTDNLNMDVWGEMDYFKRAELNNNFKKLDDSVGLIPNLDKKLTSVISVLEYDYLKIAIAGGYDYSPVLQAVNNAIVATGKRGVMNLNGLNLKIASMITVDISYVSIDGCGATIDASLINSGTAIKVVGTKVENGFTTIDHHSAFFDAIILKGDTTQSRGKAGTVGIEFNSSGESGASRLNLYSFTIAHFDTNIVFKNRAYVINFFRGNTSKANIGIHTPSGQLDAGERISFFGFTIGNCTTLVKGENPDGSLHFDTCSFDYPSGKFFEINGTQVFLSNCHIEGAGDAFTAAPFTLSGNGSTLSMKSGKIMMNSTTPTYPYLFDIQASGDNTKGGGVLIDGTFLFNLRPTTGIVASGNGYISLTNWFSYDSSQLFSILTTASNALLDGGFEQSSILDNWFITADASAVSNKFTGTNLSLSSSTDYAKTGTKSLKVAKTAVGGSNAQFALAVPTGEFGKRYAALFNYKKVGTGTGTIYADMRWGMVENNASGIPTIKYNSASISAKTIVFDANDSNNGNWTDINDGVNEVAQLKITSPATASGNVTITLDGKATTVAVSTGNSAIQVADKIRATKFSGWTTGGTAGTDTITFTSISAPGNKTDMTYSAGTTGASGTASTTAQGTASTAVVFSPKVRKPDWATHVLVTFNISGLSNGTTFYLDDCLVSKL
ncbi:hypothetical protein [Priestia megaterium]|uniref:hypothetical protein n=1 Tax=Priestia megaterium TaxID=1404 RepID=UPI0039F6CD36